MGFIFKGDKLLLTFHKRKNIWLPVGGHVQEGETDAEALKREIKEETNLNVEINEKPFFILKEKNEITPHFICKYFSGEVKIKGDEITDFKWVSKEQLGDLNLIKEVRKLSLDAFSLSKKF